jgi:hypothetical protein
VEISNRFSALENLEKSLDINRAWESTRENMEISAKEILGYHKYNYKGCKIHAKSMGIICKI